MAIHLGIVALLCAQAGWTSTYIPPGANTIFLTAGTSPAQNVINAPPYTTVTFYIRSSNVVGGFTCALDYSPAPMFATYSISGNPLGLCSAPVFYVGLGIPHTVEVICTAMVAGPTVVTLRGASACYATNDPPMYASGSATYPYFTSNATLYINPTCGSTSFADISANAAARMSTSYAAGTGTEYIFEALAPINPLLPRAASVFVEMPSTCTQGALGGHFVPRSGTGPVIVARRGNSTIVGNVRYTGYFMFDNLLAPGYYDLVLDLPGGGTSTAFTRLRYAGFLGYQPAGILSNSVTGRTIRGAYVSIWQSNGTGGYEAFASQVATDCTYGFSVPAGTYKVVIQYEAGGWQERGPFVVTGTQADKVGTVYPIPYEDIALVPVTSDTEAPVISAEPLTGETAQVRFDDLGVGLAVVEPVAGTFNNTYVTVDPYYDGAATVLFQVTRIDPNLPGTLVMRAVDRLGNLVEETVSFDGAVSNTPVGSPLLAAVVGSEVTLSWRYDESVVDGCRLYRRLGISESLLNASDLITGTGGEVAFTDRVPDLDTVTEVVYSYAGVRDGLELARSPEISVFVTGTAGLQPYLVCDANPITASTTFRLGMPRSGAATLAIFDVRGARVATLVEGDLQAGETVAHWQGRNDRGVAVASGLYFAKLSTGFGQRTVKVTVTR